MPTRDPTVFPGPSLISRRNSLRQMLQICGASVAALCDPVPLLSALPQSSHTSHVRTESHPSPFSRQDDAILDQIQHANFLFFWEQGHPQTGLIKDRCNTRMKDSSIVASIASTGFGLTAICIAEKRGFIGHSDARLRVVQTLSSLWHRLPTHRGFYFHFANIATGERIWDAEASSVDTAILLCGVLMCKAHFHEADIRELAQAIYDRVDWSWLSEDTELLPMGWTPELGFLASKWDDYSELMMIYLLGMGSTTHPLRSEAWSAWKRTLFEYDGIRYIGSYAPLFVHQYSQAWFDFRDEKDRFADYFQNSILATEAHRRFCVDMNTRFPDYTNALWGITASDTVDGYAAWGGPPATGPIDGTIVPCAAAGSLPFLPSETMRVLHTIHEHYPQTWSRYGFVDAFNPLTGWVDTDVVGIDTGITMLMAENARSGFVWSTFMRNAEAQRGMQMAGFQKYTHAPYPLDGLTG